MPGARNKRCRQARPLTGVGRLAERERPGLQKRFINAGPGRSRREALTHPGQGRHRPRPLASRNVGVAQTVCVEGFEFTEIILYKSTSVSDQCGGWTYRQCQPSESLPGD